ncbi:MAG: LacI family DNA-binding transcriptional regulator [Butyrivibrio sp.]|nr:LacI family DNA-binding transcriptional regulator [Butyrivibrio sp.]
MSVKRIAGEVGCSPATVSRVLRDPGYHCQEKGLEERIREAAIRIGYAPNEAARNLKLGITGQQDRTFSLCILMTRTDERQTDPFFLELLRIVESEIHRSRHILSRIAFRPMFSDDKACSRADLYGELDQLFHDMERQPDGLIILGRCSRHVIRLLKERVRAIVSINRNSTNYEVDEVLCDGRKIASIAVEHLITLGHRDIGYVGECRNEARYAGYLETLRRHDIPVSPSDDVIEVKQTEMEGFRAMEQLLARQDRPTGIYCANDVLAIGMLKCMASRKGGIYHPSIISSDDIEAAQLTTPMLTTVRLPKDEMGRLALYLLMDRLQGGHTSVIRTEFEGRLMHRGSCQMMNEADWSDYII